MKPIRFLISRTDNIGDVVLTLPLCKALKQQYPACVIIFLCRSYTAPIIEACPYVDGFLLWDRLELLPESEQIARLQNENLDCVMHVFPVKAIARLAKQAKIPIRVGTYSRLYHFLYCNKLVLLNRKRSNLHEAVLNLKLAQSFIKPNLSIHELFTDLLVPQAELPSEMAFNSRKIKLALHLKSNKHAREWQIEHWRKLIERLSVKRFDLYLTGTETEGKIIRDNLGESLRFVNDMTGRFTLAELIAFLAKVDGVVACSTGPLHIGAALGKFALGLYPSIRPMHAQRWKPLGKNAHYLALAKNCSRCKHTHETCVCLNALSPELVCANVESYFLKQTLLQPSR